MDIDTSQAQSVLKTYVRMLPCLLPCLVREGKERFFSFIHFILFFPRTGNETDTAAVYSSYTGHRGWGVWWCGVVWWGATYMYVCIYKYGMFNGSTSPGDADGIDQRLMACPGEAEYSTLRRSDPPTPTPFPLRGYRIGSRDRGRCEDHPWVWACGMEGNRSPSRNATAHCKYQLTRMIGQSFWNNLFRLFPS